MQKKHVKIIHYPCDKNKLKMNRNFLNLIKGIYKKYQKNESFPPKTNFQTNKDVFFLLSNVLEVLTGDTAGWKLK